MLKRGDFDIHGEKDKGTTGPVDLFKDRDGNIYRGRQDGKGEAELLHDNIGNYRQERMVSDEDNVMRTEIRASLILINYSCTHDDNGAAFGVEPSATWNVGDPMPSGRRPRKTKGWRFWSSLPLTATMEEHAVHLLEQLKPDFAKLAALDPEEAALSFAVESYNGDRPALGMEHGLMAKLVAMKLDLDIDLYVFY